MRFEMKELDAKEKYRILTSSIVPRPIAWVSSINQKNIPNLAPFSYFTGVSIEPPLLLFAVERRNQEKKDTLRNIEQTNEFVIHLVTEETVAQMNITSKDFAPGVNEIEEAGLTMVPSSAVRPPSVKEAPIRLECRLKEIIDIGSSPHSLIIGEVIIIMVDDKVLVEGRIQMENLKAVGRMGGEWYTKTIHSFALPRLDWRKKEI